MKTIIENIMEEFDIKSHFKKVINRREEILEAFIAKYKCEPDDIVQIESQGVMEYDRETDSYHVSMKGWVRLKTEKEKQIEKEHDQGLKTVEEIKQFIIKENEHHEEAKKQVFRGNISWREHDAIIFGNNLILTFIEGEPDEN